MTTKYAIIGNSAAAVGAVEGIRKVDPSGSITIISNEPYHVYSRPLISEYLAKETTVGHMTYRSADFYETNGVEAILGNGAESIDFNAKTIKLEDGSTVEYEKLLLATGGKPFVPPITGSDKKDVYTFTTLADAIKLDELLDDIQDFVVLGGGLIGLKCAESLRKRGVKVTIVELSDRVMATVLDSQAGHLVEMGLDVEGIDVVTGDTVDEILGEGVSISGVRLKSGRELPCRAVVIAIGVAPNVDLVKESAVKINRGIVVNDEMETSVSGVYAAGDVAEGRDALLGTERVLPIWPNAYVQGRIAGSAMAGTPHTFSGGYSMNSIELFGTPVINIGLSNAADDKYEIVSRADGCVYRKLIFEGNKLVGAIVVGEIDRAGLLTGLVKGGYDVSSFKAELLRSDFNRMDLPQEIREGRVPAL